VYDSATGEELAGIKGQHVYLAVKNASDIKRAGDVLFKRAWLAGLGRIEIAQNGAQLVRGLIDAAVWQPSRLDFAAGAVCGEGIERRPPDGVFSEGGLLDTESVILNLTPDEERQYSEMVHTAKGRTLQASTQQREHHIENVALAQGTNTEVVRARYDLAEDKGVLGNDFQIELAYDRGTINVADILCNAEKYHGTVCLDPLEPDYNNRHPVGKIYNDSKGAFIDSKAHGGRVFTLGSMAALVFLERASDGATFKDLMAEVRRDACDLSEATALLTRITDGPFNEPERVLLRAELEGGLKDAKRLTPEIKALIHGDKPQDAPQAPQVIGPVVALPDITPLCGLGFKRLLQATGVHGQNAEAMMTEVFGERLGAMGGALRWWSGCSWDAVGDEDLKRFAIRALAPLHDKMPNVNGTVEALHIVAPAQNAPARDRRVYFKNCVINVESGEVSPHHRDNGNTATLSVELDHNAVCPAWHKFLSDIFGGTPDEADRTMLLQEIMGWAMLRDDLNVQKVIAFDGASRAGKGVVFEVLQEILGSGMSGAASFQNLHNGKTQSAFIHKDVIFDYEAKPPASNLIPPCIGFLNKLASNENVSIEMLHKQQPWEGRLNAKFMIACNGIPAMMDSSGASANRFQVLMFLRSFYGNEDFGLADRLRGEAVGIARWALEGARRLVLNRGRFTQPATSQVAAGDLQATNKPMDDFLNEYVVFGLEEKCHVSDLWAAYQLWSNDTNTKGCSKATFLRSFRQSVLGDDRVERKDSLRIDGKVSTGYVGISAKSPIVDAAFKPTLVK
jgi:P4 family phage/plasmid primase-like protien